MNQYHNIKNISFNKKMLHIEIDGHDRHFALQDISEILLNAAESERNNFEISPSGYGIHWPDLDEDISIDGLLGIAHERKDKRLVA